MTPDNASATTSKTREASTWAPLVAGFLGGATSTVFLFPLDVVKVRLQVSENGSRLGKNSAVNASQQVLGTDAPRPPRRKKFLRTFFGMIKHEGGAALYQGLTPGLVGSAVSWGGYFFVYEYFKTLWRNRSFLSETKKWEEHNYRRRHHLSALETFFISCSAGAVMVGLTNPIWLIKTRLQLQPRLKKWEVQHHGVATSTKQYTGMVDAARTIVKEEGFRALYKGAVPALMLTSHGGVQFVSYEFLKRHFGEYQKASRQSSSVKSSTVTERLIDSAGYLTMGAISKILASTITYPVQVIKSRLQQRSHQLEIIEESGEVRTVTRQYKGVFDCASRMFHAEGLGGFFKGCLPNALRVAPSAAITFVTYEAVMDYLLGT